MQVGHEIRRAILGFASTALVFVSLVDSAIAQRSVPVIVENPASEPVPIYTAGRSSYQIHYTVSSSTSGEACSVIPVPAGFVLTITSIGVDATIDLDDSPDVYLRVTRSQSGSVSLDRFRGAMILQESFTTSRAYTAIYQTTTVLGATESGGSFSGSICIAGVPSSGDVSTARGVVSGYVEPGTIIDGATLP